MLKRMKNRITFLLPVFSFILFFRTSVQAQLGASSLKGPGMAVSVDYLPASHYIRPEDSLKMPGNTARQRYNFGMGFNLSSRVDSATGKARIWNLAAGGSYTKLSNKDYDNTIIFPNELLGAQIALQHTRTLNKKWSLMAVVAGGLFTDLEKIDQNDFFINGGVIFVKRVNPHFGYGLGAMLTNSFGTPMILPAFMIMWQTGNRFKVDINFPEKISVSSSLSKYDELALALRLNGAAYDVENRPENKRLMAYQEISLGLENTFHLTKKLDFNLAGGTTLLSGITFQKKSLSEMFKTLPNHRLATNFYLSAGLRWNF